MIPIECLLGASINKDWTSRYSVFMKLAKVRAIVDRIYNKLENRLESSSKNKTSVSSLIDSFKSSCLNSLYPGSLEAYKRLF